MMGLLGAPDDVFGPDERRNALQSGLLGLASGLLQAGQPSRIPVGLGAALGQGLQGFGQGQSDALMGGLKAQQFKQQSDINNIALQKAKYDLQREKDWYGGGQTQMVGYPQPNGEVVSPSGVVPAGMGVPGGSQSLLSKLPPEMQTYVLQLGPVEGPKFLAGLAAKQMETGEWKDEEQGGIKGQRSTRTGKFEPFPASALTDQWEEVPGPNGQRFQRNVRTHEVKPIDPTPRNTTNLNMPPQRKAEDEIVGKEFGQMYVDLQKNGMQLPSKVAKLDRINSLLSKTYTGAGGESALEANKALKAAGDAMGLDTSSISEKVASGEAATALGREIALGLRNPQGGAGMPGALSNSDRDYLTSMTPNLSQTPQGRAQLIDAQKKLYQREAEVAKLARDYRKKHGNIDEGFFDELDAYSKANPLFKAPAAQAKGAPAQDGWSATVKKQ